MEVFTFFASVAVLFAICKLIENYLRSLYIDSSRSRWVLVTGCDTGFGHRLTLDLDKRGARVFAGCLTAEGEKRLKEKCSENIVTFRLDVTREDSIQNAVNLVSSTLAEKEGKFFPFINTPSVFLSFCLSFSFFLSSRFWFALRNIITDHPKKFLKCIHVYMSEMNYLSMLRYNYW